MTQRREGRRIKRSPGEWAAEAACRGASALMYPEAGVYGTTEVYGPALALCAECPVVDECREYALDFSEVHGCWGGTTPAQRRVIWSKRRRSHSRVA